MPAASTTELSRGQVQWGMQGAGKLQRSLGLEPGSASVLLRDL